MPSSRLFRKRGQRLLLSLLLSSGLGLFSYRRRSLTRSGAIGAVITGTITVGFGGWDRGFCLIFFFLSSSLLSHFRERDKERVAADKFSKGSQRDLVQALANGGVASLAALIYGIVPSPTARNLLQAGYIGALATATADTWATEVGVLSTVQPRLITTGAPVTPGTSGGITPLGTAASAAGALGLGLFFWLLNSLRRAYAALPLIALLSGLAGNLFDSLLGATVQAMYYCPHCKKETERRVHSCGTRTSFQRGLPWMNNDVVNFLATLFGALMAAALWLPLRKRQ